jgi:hypothetical protein
MSLHPIYPLPKLDHLPLSLSLDGVVGLELSDGIPVLRVSAAVQRRPSFLLRKQQEVPLSPQETHELDRYEDIDDYLSFLNRIVRNLLQSQ